jgi:hypothetical protein
MNEPKRRGRPPRTTEIERVESAEFSIDGGKIHITPMYITEPVSAAQVYADRMWAKQSVSLSRHERVGRIAAALEAQGLSMEGVVLP